MNLSTLERQILELHNGISLRPTLQTASKIGELLLAAKSQLKHGEWSPWLHRLGLRSRTAQIYMQVTKAQRSAGFEDPLSINQFLACLRTARLAARSQERIDKRLEAVDKGGTLEDRYQVHHADCRRFRWPAKVDCLASDPPWLDMPAYKWLSKFAGTHLREGGIALVQCSIDKMPTVLDIMRSTLEYFWTLSIQFTESFGLDNAPFAQAWRPLLVFSRGKLDRQGLGPVSDTLSVPPQNTNKVLHQWAQPLRPWSRWIESLTRPGAVVVDPFCGTGVTGAAVKMAGGRRFIGTEIDAETHRIALGVINDTKEGVLPPFGK
jgi:hypothetical protein